MELDITTILEALIALVSAVVTTLLIPFIKRKLSAQKLETLQTWITVAVRAAEQLFGAGAGQQKKEYVVSFLLSKGIVVDVDEVTALLESEVFRLTKAE